jgi:S-adenosylmethionine:diacylglycerol 3-amino-3-carboxypropyl transferase
MIYYSHVNEDCRPERAALDRSGSSTLVAIAGSGERLIGLLDKAQLKVVWAIDNNPEALFLTELKLQALRLLEPREYLRFVEGLHPDYPAHYTTIRPWLSADCREYWDKRPLALKAGILHIGAFERFLARLRPLLRICLGKGFLEVIQGKSSISAPQFPTLRWRFLRWLFARRWAYLLMGNFDPAFTGKNARLTVIPAALHQSLLRGTAGTSFMMHLIFFGNFAQMPVDALPPSMQLDVLEKIRQRLCSGQLKINYCRGDLLEVCQTIEAGQHPFFSLSDILSFEDQQYLRECIQLVFRKQPDAVLAARAFVRNRFREGQPDAYRKHWPRLEITDQTAQESTGMYQVFIFRPAQKAINTPKNSRI